MCGFAPGLKSSVGEGGKPNIIICCGLHSSTSKNRALPLNQLPDALMLPLAIKDCVCVGLISEWFVNRRKKVAEWDPVQDHYNGYDIVEPCLPSPNNEWMPNCQVGELQGVEQTQTRFSVNQNLTRSETATSPSKTPQTAHKSLGDPRRLTRRV